MAKLVSKTYADALFESAVEANNLDTVIEEVGLVIQSFEENDELMKLLNHPKIVKEEKVELIESIYKNRLSDTLVGFLSIIVNKGRHNYIMAIFDQFMDNVRKHKNIGVANVTTAIELTNVQKLHVETRLLELTKHSKLEMHYKVDESLIGGMIIRIGDHIVDSSIKTQLNTMAKELTKIQLS